jgi:hypothetical protein
MNTNTSHLKLEKFLLIRPAELDERKAPALAQQHILYLLAILFSWPSTWCRIMPTVYISCM